MFCIPDGKTSKGHRCILGMSPNLILMGVQKHPFFPYTSGDGHSMVALIGKWSLSRITKSGQF